MESFLSRHRSPSELPNLNDLLSHQQPATSSDAILSLLRQTALKNQGDQFRPFYSIRAVSKQFHVSRATVSRIYRQLSDERLLRPMWGSKTLLEPTDSAKRKRPRMIGIAVDLTRFRSSSQYCDHILKLQNALWRHGITAHLIFFQNFDEVLRSAKHQCARHLNAIVWPFPETHHRSALLRLNDLGMQVICLGSAPIRGIRYSYSVSRRGSLGRIVRERVLKIT
jgi:DNA-binding transcriptional regulator YhcF (GntR family)